MKKVVSILLCICFVAVSFIACNKEDSKNNATINDTIEYTYDSAYSYDEGVLRAYEDLCKAVIAGNGEVRMNSSFLDNVLQLFYTSFPLSALVESIEQGDASYIINYKYDDAENRSKEFLKKIYDIKVHCNNGYNNDTLYAVELYNYIASSIKVSENTAITCYETIMNGEGTSFSYSNMFEYLLQQKGIKAYHVLCEDKSGASRAMTMAELDGKLYYFDVFKEFEDNKGKNIKYFGMITDDIEAYGIKNMIFTSRNPASDASDLRFDPLRKSKEWALDEENLVITTTNDEIVQIAL